MESLVFSQKKQKRILLILSILRIAIGWHFLYEGLVKLFNPAWSSIGYLQSATGPFSGIFHALAGSETSLQVVDFSKPWQQDRCIQKRHSPTPSKMVQILYVQGCMISRLWKM